MSVGPQPRFPRKVSALPASGPAGDFIYVPATGNSYIADTGGTYRILNTGTSPLTTKGDLYGHSSVDARIPVGSNDQVLTADSAQALGVKWATLSGGGGANTVTTPILLSSTTVNLNEGTGAKQTLYTCPANRRCMITEVVVQKFSANPTLAQVSLGWGAGATDLLAGGSAVNFSDYSVTTATEIHLNSFSTALGSAILGTSFPVGTATQILGLKAAVAEGSALTAIVDVYGYLTDTSGVPVANVNGTGDGAAIAPASVATTGGVGVGVAAPAAGLATTKTITAAASTGNKTINKTAGTIRIAAAGSSVVLTNSLIDLNSIVGCWLSSNDTTAKSVTYVLASGSVTFNLNAAATAEVEIRWLVVN